MSTAARLIYPGTVYDFHLTIAMVLIYLVTNPSLIYLAIILIDLATVIAKRSIYLQDEFILRSFHIIDVPRIVKRITQRLNGNTSLPCAFQTCTQHPASLKLHA